MLGDVTEKSVTMVKNETTGEEEPKEVVRQLEMLFVHIFKLIPHPFLKKTCENKNDSLMGLHREISV